MLLREYLSYRLHGCYPRFFKQGAAVFYLEALQDIDNSNYHDVAHVSLIIHNKAI